MLSRARPLTRDKPENHEIVLLVLMVAYRIRNNLFHGLKSLISINDLTY